MPEAPPLNGPVDAAKSTSRVSLAAFATGATTAVDPVVTSTAAVTETTARLVRLRREPVDGLDVIAHSFVERGGPRGVRRSWSAPTTSAERPRQVPRAARQVSRRDC